MSDLQITKNYVFFVVISQLHCKILMFRKLSCLKQIKLFPKKYFCDLYAHQDLLSYIQV